MVPQRIQAVSAPKPEWVLKDDYHFLYQGEKVIAGYDDQADEFRWFDRQTMAWGPVTTPPWEAAE